MDISRRKLLQISSAQAIASASALSFPFVAKARESASAPILIGQTAAFTGTPAGTVLEMTYGAKLYIDHVNATGGINGREIRLLQRDDKFQADLAAANMAQLLKDGVVAGFLTRGTPTSMKVLEVMRPTRKPLIAPSTGAMSLRDPMIREVFNVRSSYRLEGTRLIDILHDLSISTLGFIVTKDTFGKDVMDGVAPSLTKWGITPTFVEHFDRNLMDFEAICTRVAKENPQGVVIVGATEPSVKIIRLLRTKGCNSTISTMSTNGSSQFISQLGKKMARGIGVTQVFPRSRPHKNCKLLKEESELFTALKGTRTYECITPAMTEGFTAAKVLALGLRRTDSMAPDALIEAFESFNNEDIGWLPLSYSTTNHAGFNFAELSIVDKDGHFLT